MIQILFFIFKRFYCFFDSGSGVICVVISITKTRVWGHMWSDLDNKHMIAIAKINAKTEFLIFVVLGQGPYV